MINLNIKGTEFQNILEFPSVFFDPNTAKYTHLNDSNTTLNYSKSTTGWTLIENFQDYAKFIEDRDKILQGNLIWVHFCSVHVPASLQDALDAILDVKEVLVYIDDCLESPAHTEDLLGLLRKVRSHFKLVSDSPIIEVVPQHPQPGPPKVGPLKIVEVEDIYMQGRFAHNIKRFINARHHS